MSVDFRNLYGGLVGDLRSGLAHLDVIGGSPDKSRIKGVKGAVPTRRREMESIREVHTRLGPFERLSGGMRVLERDTRQAAKASKSAEDVDASIIIATAQQPFGFEQNGCGNKDVASLY